MKISSKLNELKRSDLNCNVFDVYTYDGLSMQELLCQFFTKINECIKISNETIDLASWLVSEGLKIEVVNKLMIWLEDGTLENIINVNLFNTLHTKIENINTQTKNMKNIYQYYNLVDNDDWTIAINTAINELSNGGELFFPGGTYNITDTINFKSGCNIRGVKEHSKIKLLSHNKTLLNMLNGNAFQSKLENMCFEGCGKDNNQIGIELNGWGTVLKNCTISHFNKGVLSCGVIVEIDDCYIHNNINGVECTVLDNGAPSTMYQIKNSMLHYNDLGLYFTDFNQPNEKRPMISINIDRVAFEHNNKAYDMPGTMNGIIQNCWFEQNNERPTTHAWAWTFINNRYEPSGGKDQTPLFVERMHQEYGFGGFTEVVGGGLSTKEITLQEFSNTNLIPSNYYKLSSNNGMLNFNNQNLMSINNDVNKMYYIVYSNSVNTNIDKGNVVYTKNGVGDYTFTLNGSELRCPVINVNAYNQSMWDDNISFTTQLSYNDGATYQDWFTVNKIRVKIKNNGTPCEGKVVITILTGKIF